MTGTTAPWADCNRSISKLRASESGIVLHICTAVVVTTGILVDILS
jgi:hypothetical protein